MWIADNWKDYEVIDTSGGEKLERWGDYILVGSRNCSWPYEWLQQKCGNAGIGSVAGT